MANLGKPGFRPVVQIGRTPVSKTGCWGFESLLACQRKSEQGEQGMTAEQIETISRFLEGFYWLLEEDRQNPFGNGRAYVEPRSEDSWKQYGWAAVNLGRQLGLTPKLALEELLDGHAKMDPLANMREVNKANRFRPENERVGGAKAR